MNMHFYLKTRTVAAPEFFSGGRASDGEGANAPATLDAATELVQLGS